MGKSNFIVAKKMVEQFEKLDDSALEQKKNIQTKLAELIATIDDMSDSGYGDWMLIALKARQIIKFNKILVKFKNPE